MASTHIKDFLDNDYTNYAVYRVFQRLPHILDSLGQTQRKILYTLESFPESKKHKTAEVYSHVYTKTLYMHGDASVYTVVENLARECSNNINLLTNEGSFGYRTDKSAAAPRYTGTRFSKMARLIFPKADWPILQNQFFEGKEIESKFLLPILPVGLLNGYRGIAVGFASKILPRHPVDMIDKMIEALKYKKRKNAVWEKYQMPDIDLDSPFFTGSVKQDTTGDKDSSWLFTGKLTKMKRKYFVEVTDLPPDMNRESYIKKLKKFMDKDIIKNFTESCVKHDFNFKIKVSPELWDLTEDELLVKLDLVDKITENFTFLNPEGTGDKAVLKFQTSGDYLKHFITLRQNYYDVRKRFQLDNLKAEIQVLKARIQFIENVNSGDIVITKRKKVDIEKELEAKGYNKIDDTYDHLLGMRMYALNEENVVKFRKVIAQKEKEYQDLEKLTTEDMHIKELQILLKAVKPELVKKGLS
jgi:DNA topoisomerase-2